MATQFLIVNTNKKGTRFYYCGTEVDFMVLPCFNSSLNLGNGNGPLVEVFSSKKKAQAEIQKFQLQRMNVKVIPSPTT